MIRLSDYSTIIVDMDGTLYYQNPVRISMLGTMLRHPNKIKDYIIVLKYRRLYAKGKNEYERFKLLPDNARQIIDEWMLRRPLPFIKKYCDSELIASLKEAQKSGIRIVVYSDYPVAEKLSALQFYPDEAYYSDELGVMKPNPKGIMKAMKLSSESRENLLVIGDRDSKDGQLARNINCGSLILGKTKHARRKQYRQ